MIQTATLSPAITVSRGPTSPQAGAQVSMTTGDFAGSFAEASDAAPIANETANLAANLAANPAPSVAPISAAAAFAGPAVPIEDALHAVPAPETGRQEWAATGKALPTPALAAAATWQSIRTPESPATDGEPLPPPPVDAATLAARSSTIRPGARPIATTGRQAAAALSRFAPIIGQERADDTGEDGDAGDTNASATSASTPSPPAAGSASPATADGASPATAGLPTPLAALSADIAPVRTETGKPDIAVSDLAGPIPPAPSRSRSARRVTSTALLATAARPVAMQGQAGGTNSPRVEASARASTATAIVSPAPVPMSPVGPAPGLPSGSAPDIAETRSRTMPAIADPAADGATRPADTLISSGGRPVSNAPAAVSTLAPPVTPSESGAQAMPIAGSRGTPVATPAMPGSTTGNSVPGRSDRPATLGTTFSGPMSPMTRAPWQASALPARFATPAAAPIGQPQDLAIVPAGASSEAPALSITSVPTKAASPPHRAANDVVAAAANPPRPSLEPTPAPPPQALTPITSQGAPVPGSPDAPTAPPPLPPVDSAGA